MIREPKNRDEMIRGNSDYTWLIVRFIRVIKIDLWENWIVHREQTVFPELDGSLALFNSKADKVCSLNLLLFRGVWKGPNHSDTYLTTKEPVWFGR
jgi:hypothetical protein